LVLPIASALSAAHLKGIVHRDLKPDNIVLVEQGGTMVPKVVDFGIAKVDATKFDRRSTSEGTILGSPDYMSPEQARGDDEHIDARTDIWSLGVVLFELLSGKPPFAAAHPLALLRSIIENDAPTLESLDAADPKLSRIVERALAKDHVMRWADMRAFGRALADWALANGIDTDVTGASIAAHWTRSSRTSITNEGATTAARLAIRVSQPSDGKGVTVPSQTRADRMSSGPELAVWQGGGSPARSRRWLVVTGVVLAVAASVGLVVTLSPRLHGARSGVAASAPPTVEATSTPIIEPSVPAASVSAPAPAASTAEAVASQAPSAAPALPVDVPVCVAGLFPVSSFQPNAALDKVCSEADPRQGAALLRSELTRHGFLAKQTTEAMRLWSNLSWYELAAFAVVRGACCSSEGLAPIDLPPSVGACPSLGTSLDELVRVVRERGEADAAVATFRQTALCIERGHRLNESLQSPFAYKGAPGGGAESAFRRILERAQAR
jgi:serine/threonine-protein kinase